MPKLTPTDAPRLANLIAFLQKVQSLPGVQTLEHAAEAALLAWIASAASNLSQAAARDTQF